MKKIITLLLILIMQITSVCYAEGLDLTALSYSDLEELKIKIEAEMGTRPEWPGVYVPSGVYMVGEDIPEGTYSVRLCDQKQKGHVSVWGKAVDDYFGGGGLVISMVFGWETLFYGKADLKKGWIVEVSGDCYFGPPIKLGF